MKYKIIDETGDHKYFTIIPNYILNHSTANDIALYNIMRRAAGENGACFMTEKTMCRKLGIGEKNLHKSLEYLLRHKWVQYVGMTPAKTRPVKTYKMLNIWKQNVDFYEDEKILSKSGLSKDTRRKKRDSRQKQSKIPAQSGGIRRTIIRRTIKKNIHKKYSSLKDIKEKDLVEIARKYRTPLSFVKLQLEKMTNWLGAKNKRYKNYKRALMNWVLKSAEEQIERRQGDPTRRAVDATGVPGFKDE